MAQPSVASFFNNRKRAAIEDTKINQARKVLLLDSTQIDAPLKGGLGGYGNIIPTKVSQDLLNFQDECPNDKIKKLQEKEEKAVASKIVIAPNSANKKIIRASRTKKIKAPSNNKNIQELINKMGKPNIKPPEMPIEATQVNHQTCEDKEYITPPSSPTKRINAMDKIRMGGPSLKELKNKMTRSARLSELKASLNRFQEGDKKLKEIEAKTSQIPESPKLKGFRTIELEVQTSPQKVFSPEKAYLSPRKDSCGVRKNLLNLLTPTKNAVAIPFQSPSKELLEETSKPALTLPFKYRFLAEMFRAVDTVVQILYNRKETITFRKLKPAVEEMLKRNLTEKHLSQISNIYPDAFTFIQEKLRIFGTGNKAEQWELVIKPNVKDKDNGNMNSEQILERRRKLFNKLLDKVKDFHYEFLTSLDPPIKIQKDKITRWHAEFDIEKVPDIDLSPLPQPPPEDKLTTGKEVLERARVLFNANTRMEQALQKLKEAKETQTLPVNDAPREMPQSILKGIPKALLEKVRQKQAAKALLSMTRSVDKEKELQQYSRLPELARLTRNLFVSEKKGVLPLDVVVDKLGNCYRGNLTKVEMEDHLKIISKELPCWLMFHNIRNCVYIKLNKSADLSLVLHRLEDLCKKKSET